MSDRNRRAGASGQTADLGITPVWVDPAADTSTGDAEATEDQGPACPKFTSFYSEHYQQVVGLAFVLSGSRWAAEELTQDAFVKALRRWERVGEFDDPGAWVRRVLVNASRSRARRKASELRAVARLSGRRAPLDSLPEPDHEFWALVRRLPARQSQVVALFYLEDLSVDRIAEILGCSAGSVKQHLYRARRTLAPNWGWPLLMTL